MKLKKHFIHKTNFYFSLFEKQHIPTVCEEITFNGKPLTRLNNSNSNILRSKIIVFKLFPNYLNLKLNEKKITKNLVLKPGFAVKLNSGIKSVDTYLKAQGSSSFRKNITRSVKRLESCFDIEYKMFHGSINKSESILLMDKLYSMIENRFKQRSGRNTIGKRWDYYKDIAYNGINNKTASLFVIYSNKTPITISLNFHYDNLMFSYLSSYDINYSKFSLGNIEIYKHIEWCLNNEIILFDIGYGDYTYKRRWSNLIYNFETHYIADKSSFFLNFYAFLQHSKDKFIHYLILKRVNYFFHDTIDKLKRIDKTYVPLNYETSESNEFQHNLKSIDINAEHSYFLIKPIHDHAYKYQEHINDLKIYKSLNNSKAYTIKGKKSESGVTFK